MNNYTITLGSKDDLDQFYLDMETQYPNRCVSQRLLSRNTEYELTEEEVSSLSSDSRIINIEETPTIGAEPASWSRTSSNFAKTNTNSAYNQNWALLRCTRDTSISNWGADGTPLASGTAAVDYTGVGVDVIVADGHIDPAHPEFAENADGTGGSRVVQYNWLQNTVAAGTGTSNSTYNYSQGSSRLKDHGTKSAGLIAGNTQGWASDAAIYNINPYSGDGVTYSGTTGGYVGTMLDLIRYWHSQKPNQSYGSPKPTVLNLSVYNLEASPNYGEVQQDDVWARVSDITGNTFQGNGQTTNITASTLNSRKMNCTFKPRVVLRTTTAVSQGATSFNVFSTNIQDSFFEQSCERSGFWNYAASNSFLTGRKITSVTKTSSTYSYSGSSFAVYTVTVDSGVGTSSAAEYGYTFEYSEDCMTAPHYQSSSLAADIEDLLDEGIHIVHAAGNQNNYSAVLNDADWNNTLVIRNHTTNALSTFFYNRPSYYAVDSRVHEVGSLDNSVREQKSESSNKGARVDYYAPGVGVQTAATSYYSSAVSDLRNNSYKRGLYYGTSAAAPQAAGVLAAILENAPELTPAEAHAKILRNNKQDMMYDSFLNTGDDYSLQGNNSILHYDGEIPLYGFSSFNDDGELLVADDHASFHYLGDATLSSSASGQGDFANYGSNLAGYQSAGDNSLDGRVIYTYTITTTSSNPLVFIKPTDYTRFHGLIQQSQSGNTWTFKVIKSGTSTSNAPVIKVFVEASAIVSGTPTYGMQLRNEDNVVTFDSEKQPLIILNAGSATPPPTPTESGTPFWTGKDVLYPWRNRSGVAVTTSQRWAYPWNSHNLYHDFASDGKYRTSSLSNTTYTTDLMFASPSIAQSVQSRIKYGNKYSQGQDHNSTALWWAMYLNAFRLRSGPSSSLYFDSGWAVFAAGYDFSSVWESGGTFGGGGGTIALGTRPYADKTINLTDQGFLIADASRYS